MSFNYKSPSLSESEIAELTATKKGSYEVVEPGRYVMKIRDIRARKTANGKVIGEVLLEHTEAKGAAFATLDLFKSKEDPSVDTEVTTKQLVTIGKALGLPTSQIATMTWSEDTSADADNFGRLPAAVLVAGADGQGEPVSIKGVTLNAILDIKTFQKRDGTEGKQNVVKAIYAPDANASSGN